jgi:hypothetical protein
MLDAFLGDARRVSEYSRVISALAAYCADYAGFFVDCYKNMSQSLCQRCHYLQFVSRYGTGVLEPCRFHFLVEACESLHIEATSQTSCFQTPRRSETEMVWVGAAMVCSLEAFVLSQYLQAAVVSSAVTGSDVTVAAFKLGALHPLSFVLTPGNAVVCRKAISVYATAGEQQPCSRCGALCTQ